MRALAAPVLALGLALVVSAVVLELSGNAPGDILEVLRREGFTVRSFIATLNRGAPYYLAGVAVAIGFKMNLFNIGVEGQYRVAALLAAGVGAAVRLPAPLHVALVLAAGMAVGMAWASIAGILRARRGVSEVISTIMLNAIAFGVTPYLLERFFRAPKANAADYAKVTRTIAPRPPAQPRPGAAGGGVDPPQGSSLGSFLFVALAVGVAYYVVVWRTRFGFDLRATGSNLSAARASGVDSRRMIVVAMALSGAVAGLVGLSRILDTTGYYSADVVVRGLGFTGIAVALLGRNHPVGIAFGALLWAFMDVLQTPLARADLPKEIIAIMQGTIVLSVVVAYEVVRRVARRQEAAAIARQGGAGPSVGDGTPRSRRWRRRDRDRGRGARPAARAGAAPGRPPRSVRWTLIALGGVLLLSAVREVTGAGPLTGVSTFRSALQLSIPIALAGLGGLWAERAGVVNIGLEGMMVLGTWFGAWGGIQYGPWEGVLLGIVGGALGGLLHAVATVSFGVDHIVSGVAINLLGDGTTRFLTNVAFEGSNKASPSVPRVVPSFDVPVVSNVAEELGGQGRFFLSDLARIVEGLTSDVSLLVVLGLALFPLTFWVLWRTPLGLRLRAVGEDPVAAESLGVGVYSMKYLAVTMSGALAGLGGVTLVYVFGRQFQVGQTNGRGFIGLAAMIFGNWRPGASPSGPACSASPTPSRARPTRPPTPSSCSWRWCSHCWRYGPWCRGGGGRRD